MTHRGEHARYAHRASAPTSRTRYGYADACRPTWRWLHFSLALTRRGCRYGSERPDARQSDEDWAAVPLRPWLDASS